MNSTWTKLEGNKGEFVVTFEGQEWTKACDKALTKLAANVKLDGFRKGKAPKSFVKKMVGQGAIFNEAINYAFTNETYSQLLIENTVMPISQPELSVTEIDADHVVLKLTVECRPEVELTQYKGFDIAKEVAEVTEEAVEQKIESLRKQNAEWVVKEGAVENGDTAVIDYVGSIDGVEFEGGAGEDHPLEIGSGQFIPGFEEQVVGMNVDETKDVVVTFPTEYHADDLAGKEAVFKVTVKEVKKLELPEVDADFVADCEYEGVTTVEELTAKVKADLADEAEKAAENQYEEAIYNAVLAANPVEVPESMIEEELQQMVSELSQNLQQQGIDFKTYQAITGQTTETIKEGLKAQATDRVHFNLIVDAIIKAENLECTDEDLEAQYAEIAEATSKTVEEVKQMYAPYATYMRSSVLHEKAVKVIKGE